MMYYKLVSLILIFLSTTSFQLDARSRLKATLDFGLSSSATEASIHAPRVYYRGSIVSTYSHGTALSKVTFDIPKSNNQNRFYMLVTQELGRTLKAVLEKDDHQNTVDHLHVDPTAEYKFFVLDLVADEDTSHDQSLEALLKMQQRTYHWEIHEQTLPKDGSIPDSTIVVYYFPDMVKELKGGSLLELPTIYFNHEPVTSTPVALQEAQDALIRLQLAAIDTDTIHAPVKRKIKMDNQRLLIMDIA